MTTTITPQWSPIPLTGDSAPPAATLFKPQIVPERAALVAGGPLALSVFQVFDRQRLWYRVSAQASITGFAVSASTLYVQDGPVLAGWDLTYGGCFAAINLVTQARWTPETSNPVPPPASLYALPPNTPATAAVFSPPVVRASQVEGQVAGQVFVIGESGTLHALDDAINHVGTIQLPAPLTPSLALAELPQPGGSVLCRLYYVMADGGIAAVDGSASPIRQLPGWASKGAPDASRVLPLRVIDGLLWCGGILGADFFVTSLDPTLPCIRTIAGPPQGWRHYDVAAAEKLVIVSDGSATRLVSYDPTAMQPDRWSLRTAPTPAWTFFCPDTGLDAAPPTPRLALEVDIATGAQPATPGFRVLLGNTLDSSNPALTSQYPLPPQPLDTGVFAAGAFPTLHGIGWMRSEPLVYQQRLYCIVRSAPPGVAGGQDYLAAFGLASEIAAVAPAAHAELARISPYARPIQVMAMYVINGYNEDTGDPTTRGPMAQPGVHVAITRPAGATTTMQADGGGAIYLDTTQAGSTALMDVHDSVWGYLAQLHCTFAASPVTLGLGGNTAMVTVVDPGGP